jgi:uncharacterized phiE125 gp8 family phage protein
MTTDVIITIPEGTTPVVTLAKAKKHLRLDASFEEEDDLIETYIEAATQAAENYIGGHILAKDMVIKASAFESPFVFEAFPVKSITSVTYFEEGHEDEKNLSDENYSLTATNSKNPVIRFKNELPTLQRRFDAVTITISIGMETVAKPVVSAILLMIADLYERREDRVEVYSSAAINLLRPYKKF